MMILFVTNFLNDIFDISILSRRVHENLYTSSRSSFQERIDWSQEEIVDDDKRSGCVGCHWIDGRFSHGQRQRTGQRQWQRRIAYLTRFTRHTRLGLCRSFSIQR
jgi:hypothetical protein